MYRTDVSSVYGKFLETKQISLSDLADFHKAESQRLSENIDKNARGDYNPDTNYVENKKPVPKGTGLRVGTDPKNCGKSIVSAPAFSCNGDVMVSYSFSLCQSAQNLFENDLDVYLLLTQILFRINRKESDFNRKGLAPNQAFIGDYKSCHLTEQRYRSAKVRIEQTYRLATFQGTNKGTVVTLLKSDICVASFKKDNGQKNGQITDKQRLTYNNISSLRSDISAADEEKPKSMPKKVLAPKVAIPKPEKPQPSPEELELKAKRKKVIDLAHKHGFPLAPAEINKQIKSYSIEAVMVVVDLFVNGEWENTKDEHLKGAIYKRIDTEHVYLEEFKDNDRGPNAA